MPIVDICRKAAGEHRYEGSVANRALELLEKSRTCASTARRLVSLANLRA
jgi:hypothetical protein